MIDQAEFQKIDPQDSDDPFRKESLEIFQKRFLQFFPNFPESVFGDWPYRHFYNFCNDYWHLNFRCFKFNKETFDNETVLALKSRMTEEELKGYLRLYEDDSFSLVDRIDSFDSSTLPKEYIENFCKRYPHYTLVGDDSWKDDPVKHRCDLMMS